MKAINLIAVLVCANMVSTAHSQSLEHWQLPDPTEMIKASNALCVDQAKATLAAGALRSQGHSKDEVLALVPESPKAMPLRVVSAMRESVEDSFDFPELSPYAQFSFRSEVCSRETLGGLRMPRLSTVHLQVEKCQRVNGPEKSSALFQCIHAVVQSAQPQL